MSLFLTFQMCVLIANYGFGNYGFSISIQSNVGNVYSYYVAYDVQLSDIA